MTIDIVSANAAGIVGNNDSISSPDGEAISADGRYRRLLLGWPATWCRATPTAHAMCSCATGRPGTTRG